MGMPITTSVACSSSKAGSTMRLRNGRKLWQCSLMMPRPTPVWGMLFCKRAGRKKRLPIIKRQEWSDGSQSGHTGSRDFRRQRCDFFSDASCVLRRVRQICWRNRCRRKRPADSDLAWWFPSGENAWERHCPLSSRYSASPGGAPLKPPSPHRSQFPRCSGNRNCTLKAFPAIEEKQNGRTPLEVRPLFECFGLP